MDVTLVKPTIDDHSELREYVKELATMIWQKLGKTEPITFISDPAYEYDVQKRVPSVRKAKELLDFEATTDLSTTLDEVIPWICNQIDLGNI